VRYNEQEEEAKSRNSEGGWERLALVVDLLSYKDIPFA